MTQTRKVPEGYHSVQPYLMFMHCHEAMTFYAKVFNSTEKLVMKTPEGRVAHAEIVIGDSVVMMADENADLKAFGVAHYGGSPVSLMVYVDDCDTTYAKAVEAGAASLREPSDQPYGDRMAGIVDPFGYKWWVAHSLAKESETAMEAVQ